MNGELTFQVHSNLDTFLKPAGFAVVATAFVHRALSLELAQPRLSSPARPLVEPAAAITREHPIMLPSGPVSTYFTSWKLRTKFNVPSVWLIQWNPDFSNPRFSVNLPFSRTNFRFPWRFEKPGFYCVYFFKPFQSLSPTLKHVM